MSKDIRSIMREMNVGPWYDILWVPAKEPVIDWMLPVRTQNFWRRGWATYPWYCPACNTKHKMTSRIAVYRNHKCAQCGYVERAAVIFEGDLPSDGVWL